MLTTVRRGRRVLTAGLASCLASVALLTACGGGGESDDAAASSSPAGSSGAEESPAPDLASGLLPAEAFGQEATVVPISLEQLRQGAGVAAQGVEGLQITPEACAAAVQGTQPSFDDFGDVVGQSATVGSAVTVEVLVRGGPTKDTVSQLADAAARCPEAQITSPQIGTATITFQDIPVDDLGDGSALLQYTTSVTLPDGTPATVPALIGAVQDGDRLLVLMNLDAGSATPGGAAATPPDPAAFADLLEQAYEAQAEALD